MHSYLNIHNFNNECNAASDDSGESVLSQSSERKLGLIQTQHYFKNRDHSSTQL